MQAHAFRLLFLAALAAYAAAILYPFRLVIPHQESNSVEANAAGGLRFKGPDAGLARTPAAPDWVVDAKRAHRLEVTLRVRPLLSQQWGPARILTLSRGPRSRNLTIGHEGTDLIIRIRTPWHSTNGKPQLRVPDVFRAGQWTDIRLAIEPGRLRAEVNGEPVIEEALPERPLSGWSSSFRLALGNELTGNRTWLGDVQSAAVQSEDTRIDYAAQSTLEMPARFWVLHSALDLRFFRDLVPYDVTLNVLGFVPLGIIVGFWLSGRGPPRWWRALMLIVATSAVLELLQILFPPRYPSINDVFFNGVGGWLGLRLAHWTKRVARRGPTMAGH